MLKIDFIILKRSILSVVVLALIIYPIFIIKDNLYFPMEFSDFIYTLGKYCGFTAYFIFFLQYFWIAKVKFLEHILPYDIRVAIHRTFGILGLFLIILHPISILFYYANMEVPIEINIQLAFGYFSFTLVLIVFASILIKKIFSVKYETWKKIHWLSFGILTFGFFHGLLMGSDIYGIHKTVWIILWLVHIILVTINFTHKLYKKNKKYIIKEIIYVTPMVTTIKIDLNWDFKPGQFGFISVKLDDKWQPWHPFSISTSPENNFISFTIKNLGDFTSRINELNVGDKVRVDLAYGGFSTAYFNDSRYVFIAGGVGITPIFSNISALYNSKSQVKVVLLYSLNTEDEIIFREELELMFKDRPDWDLKYVITFQRNWVGYKGFISSKNIKELCNNDFNGTFFLCGPLPMVSSLKKYLKSIGKRRKDIRTEEFKFI